MVSKQFNPDCLVPNWVFVYGAVENAARGNWTGAGINLLFAGMNYFINRK
jgi:hypothetical protein